MKYRLIRNSHVGVIVDNTPVFRDVKDTFTVSFILPENGAYTAVFRDENGVEYNAAVRDGAARVPRQILSKSQLVGLTVCLLNDSEIIWTWECQTLKVGTFLSLRKTQWQLTSGVDDKKLFSRLAEIETEHADLLAAFKALNRQTEQCNSQVDSYSREVEKSAADCEKQLLELREKLTEMKAANETLAAAYNKATEVINGLSERVYNLEKNYDPTVIE